MDGGRHLVLRVAECSQHPFDPAQAKVDLARVEPPELVQRGL
jgi:hypothetical protein